MKRIPFFLLVFGLSAALAFVSSAQQQDKAKISITAGDGHMRFKDYAQAVASYTAAIAADPGSIEAYLKRARAYLEWGGKANEDRALGDAAKVITLEPANGSAHYTRGKVYFNRARAAEKAKDQSEARALFGRALADYEIAQVAYPDWVSLLVDMGYAYFVGGDLDRALAVFSRAYEKKPSYSLNVDDSLYRVFSEFSRQKRDFDCGTAPRTWHLAGLYWMKIRPERAVQCFSRALELGMTPHDVYYDRARAHAERRDFANAIADATSAITLLPIASNYMLRAEIHEKQGDLDSAIKDYTQAIQDRKKGLKKSLSQDDYLTKSESLYRLYLKRANAFTGRKSWDRAAADYLAAEKMLTPGPGRAAIYRLIADIYEQKGDAGNAARYKRKAEESPRR